MRGLSLERLQDHSKDAGGQRLLLDEAIRSSRCGLHEAGESAAEIGIVDDEESTGSKVLPCEVHLEEHVTARVKAVMDEHVERPVVSEDCWELGSAAAADPVPLRSERLGHCSASFSRLEEGNLRKIDTPQLTVSISIEGCQDHSGGEATGHPCLDDPFGLQVEHRLPRSSRSLLGGVVVVALAETPPSLLEYLLDSATERAVAIRAPCQKFVNRVRRHLAAEGVNGLPMFGAEAPLGLAAQPSTELFGARPVVPDASKNLGREGIRCWRHLKAMPFYSDIGLLEPT